MVKLAEKQLLVPVVGIPAYLVTDLADVEKLIHGEVESQLVVWSGYVVVRAGVVHLKLIEVQCATEGEPCKGWLVLDA